MIEKLNNKQRKFLVYIRDIHMCLGYTTTIPRVLYKGSYDGYEKSTLNRMIVDFENYKEKRISNAKYGGLPTKYLK